MATKTMSIPDALRKLLNADHGFMGPDWCREVASAFGIDRIPAMHQEVDTRFQFKGLTIRMAEGHMTLPEYRRWVKANWYWLKPNKKMTQTAYVDDTWMAYTAAEPEGYGLDGVPYTSGINSETFACWLCDELGVPYHSYIGRGFQLQGCVQSLSDKYGVPPSPRKEQVA